MIKTFLLIDSIILISIGVYSDLKAISYNGYLFFYIGLILSLVIIVIDFKKYSFFFRPRKHFTDIASSIETLIRNTHRIIAIFFVLISLVIAALSFVFRSTDAFDKLISELPNDTEYSIGFIVSGSVSTKSDSESDGRACFKFALYSYENSRVNACLLKKEDNWVIDDNGIQYK